MPGAAPETVEAPTIDRPVVDRTGRLSDGEVRALEHRLMRLRERTGAQMAVLLVATTGDEPIEDFSMRVAEAWRGGSAERDDGLLLTLAMLDRRMRLEVGYGLEASITDAEAQVILAGMRDTLRSGATAEAVAGAIERVGRELPRLDASFFDGGALTRPEPGVFCGVPFTLAALACVLAFLHAPPRRARTKAGWTAFATVTLVFGALFAWLYADLEGLALREAVAFVGAVTLLVGLGRPIDVKARALPDAFSRYCLYVPSMIVLTFVAAALTGAWLGSAIALLLLGAALFSALTLSPFIAGGLWASRESSYWTGRAPSARSRARGSSRSHGSSPSSSSSAVSTPSSTFASSDSSESSSTSASSSSSTSSSSSSSSSYDGGGGGFGGGGASSGW